MVSMYSGRNDLEFHELTWVISKIRLRSKGKLQKCLPNNSQVKPSGAMLCASGWMRVRAESLAERTAFAKAQGKPGSVQGRKETHGD